MTKEFDWVLRFIDKGSKVLDVGCGEGKLLSLLKYKHNCNAYGIDNNIEAIINNAKQGHNIMHHDLNLGIKHIGTDVFDCIVMTDSVQELKNPKDIILQMLEVSKVTILSFPNFGYWRSRFQLLFKGKMPASKNANYHWYNTPNIHFFTYLDFVEFCEEEGIAIVAKKQLGGHFVETVLAYLLPNLFAKTVIVKMTKNG